MREHVESSHNLLPPILGIPPSQALFRPSVPDIGKLHHILYARNRWLEGQVRLGNGWSEHPVSESPKAKFEPPDPGSSPRSFYRHERHPEYEFWYPIPLLKQEDASPGILAPYVSCITWCATLFLERAVDKYRNALDYSLRDSEHTWAGTIQLHDESNGNTKFAQNLDGRIELVEIASGSSRDPLRSSLWDDDVTFEEEPGPSGWFHCYYVIWVEWIGGIAYRKGLGRVRGEIWEKKRGEPFALMLGSKV
ncbi:hypothetical protein FSARC_14544 [Fusarium sarcochroum]|uniref:Uncharacterized protein n=1 Tax=Fusarium sarcochroum TaxID=1208366 RepID=A0A8H4SSD4_9HYPO|nr:hypothetical protein FSARC_14544 [Fusarium sarcochroum]